MKEQKSFKEIRANFILKLYRESTKNVPVLKYSWVLIATICILALVGYFKLKNEDVFLYALYVLLISFLGYVFSALLKNRDKPIRIALYTFVYSLIVAMCAMVLSFAYFILFAKPTFYKRWFSDKSISIISSKKNSEDSVQKMPYRFENVNSNKKPNTENFKSFKILPSGNFNLEKMISKDGYVVSNKNANYSIKITFSGNLEEVSKNLYRYPGGFAIIKINGVDCMSLEDKIIPPTFFGGNNKSQVLKEINDNVEKLISDNQNDFLNQIKICLKKF